LRKGTRYYTVTTPLCVASLEAVVDGFSTQPYSLEDALLWGVELAIEVHTLHSRCRLFHGDISGRNVLLGPDHHIYVGGPGAGRAQPPLRHEAGSRCTNAPHRHGGAGDE
jgi:hypothetical protein